MILFSTIAKIWYSLPLIAVVSLCYGATRHEHLREIAIHAIRTCIWVLGFMALIFLVVVLSGYWI
ncbi:hypothetical protein [Mariniblastus fucicola]|nr:hypothetical protein [Mariniblastus fucicola]